MQTDNHNFRKNVTANEKYIVEKNEFKVSNNSTLYMFYYKTWTLLKLRGYGDKWDRSETSSIGWIRLLALISSETKTIHNIISRNSTLSMPIEIYLEASSSSSKEVFFTGDTSHLTTGSSVKSKLYLKMSLVCMSLTCFSFFPLITTFDATLFCGDFYNSSFSYSNVKILLINSLQVCGALTLLVCTASKLGYRIAHGNREVKNTSHLFEQHDHTSILSLLSFFILSQSHHK